MRTQIAKREVWLVLLFALGATPGSAACINPPLSLAVINQFKLNPQELILTPDADTRTVEAKTRDLAGTDSSLAPDLVRIAEGALPRFRAAIAAGLGQAALTCLGADQKAALQIQQAVANFQDGQFQALFAAVVGDLSTAATAAAESAATSSVGSVTIVNPNTSTGAISEPGGGGFVSPIGVGATTNLTVVRASIFGVAGPSATTSVGNATTSVGNTASNPVSPTR